MKNVSSDEIALAIIIGSIAIIISIFLVRKLVLFHKKLVREVNLIGNYEILEEVIRNCTENTRRYLAGEIITHEEAWWLDNELDPDGFIGKEVAKAMDMEIGYLMDALFEYQELLQYDGEQPETES